MSSSPPWCVDFTAEDWRTEYDERAGIAEYVGGLTRAEAERDAAAHVAKGRALQARWRMLDTGDRGRT